MRRKNVEFYEDKCLNVRFRSRLADFRDSGYDRGHMVRPLPSPEKLPATIIVAWSCKGGKMQKLSVQ